MYNNKNRSDVVFDANVILVIFPPSWKNPLALQKVELKFHFEQFTVYRLVFRIHQQGTQVSRFLPLNPPQFRVRLDGEDFLPS